MTDYERLSLALQSLMLAAADIHLSEAYNKTDNMGIKMIIDDWKKARTELKAKVTQSLGESKQN